MFLWQPIVSNERPRTSSYLDTGATGPLSLTNPTFLPDDFLLSWQPLFLIRHPALTFESWYRMESRVATVELDSPKFDSFTSFRCSRHLYDWYVSKLPAPASPSLDSDGTVASPPLVIDADDVIMREPVERLCELLKMDPLHLIWEWDATNMPESTNSRSKAFMGCLWQSTSIDTTKTSKGIDIAARHEQWKAEFGVEPADVLLRRVSDAMEDYSYLYSRKV